MKNKISYSEKLTDPRWQRRRLEVFNRDNWTCQCCSNKVLQLEIHHIEYWTGKEPWEYPDNMLITICRDCHEVETVRFKHEQYLLKSLLSNGFLANDLLALSTMLSTHIKFREQLLKNIRQYINS